MKIESVKDRVPETKNLTDDQMKAAVKRARAQIAKIELMEGAVLTDHIAGLCIELEYLREVKDFQKDIIQKRAKGG